MAYWSRRRRSRWTSSQWPEYVPVSSRRSEAQGEIAKLRKKGRTIDPVVLETKTIATTFWGKAWCANLESYSDYSNRLPRGRSYVRNGAVIHLSIDEGKLEALVRGSSTYTVTIEIAKVAARRWSSVVSECTGKVGSLVELLRGRLPPSVMGIVTDHARGLFPAPKEITLGCTCPDWATMCKHVAAVLYATGARLDQRPELLFLLRGVKPEELVSKSDLATRAPSRERRLTDASLADVFGIDMVEDEPAPRLRNAKKPRSKPRARQRGR